MGHALFWLALLATSITWAAWMASRAARSSTRLLGALGALAGFSIPFALGAGATVGLAWLGEAGFRIPWLPVTAAWTGAYLLGAIGIGWAAIRRSAGGDYPAAATWSRGRLATATGVAALISLVSFGRLDSAVHERMGELRSEAKMLALSAAPARVSDRANAAHLYARAFEALGSLTPPPHDRRFAEWDSPGKPELNATSAELQEYLDAREPVLSLLREAAALPDCVFERDFARPTFDMLLPELAELRQGTRLLGLSARRHAQEGRPREAIADIRAILGVADHLSVDGPILISWLCANAARHRALQVLSAVLAESQASAEDLAGLRLEQAVSYARLLPRSLLIEEAFALHTFASDAVPTADLLAALSSDGTVIPAAILPFWRVFFFEADVEAYRTQIKEFRNRTLRPYHEGRSRGGSVVGERSGLLTALLLPSLESCAAGGARADARLAAAIVGVAAERFRADHGAYPDRAEDLTPAYLPAIPIDPFDGAPMRWRAAESGAVCWSVGENGTDEGGVEDPITQDGDVVFRLGDAVREAD